MHDPEPVMDLRHLPRRPMTARRTALICAAVVTTMVLGIGGPAAAAQAKDGGPGLIVFAGETASGSQLWTVRPDGTRLHQITHVSGGAVQPDWSPDGRTVAFEWDVPSPDGPHVQIALVNADGSGLRALPIDAGACVNGQPNFTADG